MNSVNRVLEAHGDEISQHYAQQVLESIKDHFKGVTLENNLYSIEVTYTFNNDGYLQGPSIDKSSAEWLDLPAVGVDVALYGSSAVVSNLDGLSWLRVR